MKNKLSTILVLLSFAQFYGQNAKLSGTVVQDENDYLLSDITIYLISKTKDTVSSVTNYNGKYTFESIKKGEYKLRASSRYYPQDTLDTLISISESVNKLDLRLKSYFKQTVFKKNKYFKFKYREVPTSTFDYEYIITKDSVYLNQTLLVPIKGSDYEFRAKHSNYAYALSPKEKITLENLVKSNNLLLVSSYEKRMVLFGPVWKIKFDYQSLTYTLDLPNYHNQGLEELLTYATGLIPKRKKMKWTRR